MTPGLRTWFPAHSKAVEEAGAGGLSVTITSFNTGGVSTKKTSQRLTLRPGWRRQSLTHARLSTPTMRGPQTQATSLCLLDPTGGEHSCSHLGRYLWRCWCAEFGICFSCWLKLFKIEFRFFFFLSLVRLLDSVCLCGLFYEFLWINQKKKGRKEKMSKKKCGGSDGFLSWILCYSFYFLIVYLLLANNTQATHF